MLKQVLRSLSLSYRKKSWLAPAEPSLILVWHRLQNCSLLSSQIIFYSQCHVKRRFGWAGALFAWQRQRSQDLYLHVMAPILYWRGKNLWLRILSQQMTIWMLENYECIYVRIEFFDLVFVFNLHAAIYQGKFHILDFTEMIGPRY